MTSNTIADRLRAAIVETCKAHQVAIEVGGNAALITLHLPPQEGADETLLDELLHQEMQTAGVPLDAALAAGAMNADQADAAEQAFRTALARMRTLLIEFNSYLSGGLPWVYADAEDTLGARGIAKYRYPARAPVDVVAESDHMRIHVHHADLGEVTSSGFYIPTRVRGDFTATLRYRLDAWQPGAHSVCIALFAQDEPSQLRYYSQRRTAGERPHEVMANFNNVHLTEPIPVEIREGAFRLERRGDLVISLHREGSDGAWTTLGEHRGDPTNDVIFGSKIWSSGKAGPFDARLFDLRIVGEIPDDQIGPVPVRPDPRDP